MRKGIVLVATLVIGSASMAQKANVTSAAMEYQDYQSAFMEMLQKVMETKQPPSSDMVQEAVKPLLSAKEYITPALEHPKSAEWNKTHRYNSMINFSLMSMAAMDSTNPDMAKYRDEAFAEEVSKSFKKFYEVDSENRYTADVEQELGMFRNQGVMAIKQGEAMQSAEMQMQGYILVAQISSYMQLFDSASTYNAGLFAMQAEEYEVAEKMFRKCLENGFRPGLSAKSVSEALMKQDKNEEAVALLEENMKKYPGDPDLLFGLINYYLGTGNSEKAEGYLKEGIAQDPTNKSLMFALGTVYDKSGKFDEAAEQYNKALEIDPKYYDALYNLGAVKFNQGVALKNDASLASDVDYPKLMEKANAKFNEAIETFLKAREAYPEDKGFVQSLRDSYRAVGDKENMTKYHEMLKTM